MQAIHSLLDKQRKKYSTNKVDSLLGTAYNYATFDAGIGVYDETISSGKMRLIQNDSLKFLLTGCTGKLNDLKEDVLIRREYFIHNVSPLFRKYIPLRNMDNAIKRDDYKRFHKISNMVIPKANYEAFFNSIEVDGTLYEMYWNQSFTMSNEASLKTT